MNEPNVTAFRVGERYSSTEIQNALSVGNEGGVRVSLNGAGAVERLVIMTSFSDARQIKENPYHDRIENDVLVYTGAGREGDQTVGGVNSRIAQQLKVPFPMYAFRQIASRRDRQVGPKRWQFLGLLEYLRHYPETQVDARGEVRRAWVFELRVHEEPSVMPVENEAALSAQVIAAAREADRAEADAREIVTTPPTDNTAAAAQEAQEIEAVRARLLAVTPQDFENLVPQLGSING